MKKDTITMVRKYVCALLAAIMIISLCACGGGNSSSRTTEEETTKAATTTAEPETTKAETTTEKETTTVTTTEEQTTTEAATKEETTTAKETEPETEPEDEPETEPVTTQKTAKTNDNGGLSDDWTDFKFALEGKVYKLPFLYSILEEDGWKTKDADETLKPNSYTIVTMENDGKKISAAVLNLDVNVLKISDCYIFRVAMNESYIKTGAELVFPGGIMYGASVDEIVGMYGDPTDIYESTTTNSYTYKADSYATLKVRFNIETDQAIDIALENAYPDEPVVSKGSASAGEVPEVVSRYKAPEALGDDYTTFNVRYAGDLYTLPAPVSAFVENGWKIMDNTVTVPARSTKVGFSITKNNQNYRAIIRNYSDTVQPAENTFIVKVSSSDYGPKVDIELPGGITMDSKRDDIIAAYGEPDKTDDSASHDYYTYGSYSESLSFTIEKETDRIITIELDYTPRNLAYE